MIKKIKENKKAIELTFQTIVVFMILIIVLIFMIFFFVNHYGSNSDSLHNVSSSAIDAAKNFK
jgi:uncharacterized protein (UPF0333 family)